MGHSRSSLKCPTSPPLYPCLSFKPKYWANLSLFQWRIQGWGPGGPPPLFLYKNKVLRSEKNFLANAPPPPPPPISRSGSGTVFFCLVVHCLAVRISLPFYILYTSCYCTDPGLQLWHPAPLNSLSLWTCCHLIFWQFKSRFHINQNPWDDPGNIANNNNDFAKFWEVNKVHLVYVKMVNSPYQEPITRLLPLCVFTSNDQISLPSLILKL